MHTLQKAFSNSERETASWWPLQESADLQIARAATILALGKHPQAVTSLRAVEKMLVENYPIPRQAASRCGAGNFWHHPRDGFVQFSHGHAPAHSSISSCAATRPIRPNRAQNRPILRTRLSGDSARFSVWELHGQAIWGLCQIQCMGATGQAIWGLCQIQCMGTQLRLSLDSA